MNYSKYDPKNDVKQDTGHATVNVPTTPDANQGKGPAQGEQKGSDAKPAVQAPGSPDAGNQAKSNGQDHNPPARADGQAVVNAASEDKASGESMVSEGGHASPGKTPDPVREPDAAIPVKNEPSKGSADGAADKPALSAQSDR